MFITGGWGRCSICMRGGVICWNHVSNTLLAWIRPTFWTLRVQFSCLKSIFYISYFLKMVLTKCKCCCVLIFLENFQVRSVYNCVFQFSVMLGLDQYLTYRIYMYAHTTYRYRKSYPVRYFFARVNLLFTCYFTVYAGDLYTCHLQMLWKYSIHLYTSIHPSRYSAYSCTCKSGVAVAKAIAPVFE